MRVSSRNGLPARIISATMSAILAFGGWPVSGLQVLAGTSVAYAEEDQAISEDLVIDLDEGDLSLVEEQAPEEGLQSGDGEGETLAPVEESEPVVEEDSNEPEVTDVVDQGEATDVQGADEGVIEEVPATDEPEDAAPIAAQAAADDEGNPEGTLEDEPELTAQASNPDDLPQVHLDNDRGTIYSDGSLVLHYTEDEGINSSYRVVIELGVFHMDNETEGHFDPDFTGEAGNAYTFDANAREIVLNGQWLWNEYFKDHQDEELRVSVWLLNAYGDQVHPYNPEHGEYTIREARVDYRLPNDTIMLSGWENKIDRNSTAWAETSAFPGLEAAFTITNVDVVEHPDEYVSQVVELREDENGWSWRAKGYGSADFTLTYITLDGEMATHTFTVFVKDEIYDVEWAIVGNTAYGSANNSYMGLPGQSIVLRAAGVQRVEDGANVYDGFDYDWELVSGGDYASITWLTQDDGSSLATVTFNEYGGDEFLIEKVVVQVTATKAGASATSDEITLVVSNEYPEIWIQETGTTSIDDILMGDTRQVTPEVRYFKQGEDGPTFEMCELEYVTWSFDENCVSITDASGNKVSSGSDCGPSTFFITRQGDWDTDIDLVVKWRPTESQYPEAAGGDGLRHESTRFHLSRQNAELFFEGDVPDHLFVTDDNNTVSLTVNRQNVSDAAYLDWTVGLCVEDDWIENHIFTEGVEYTVEGNTITLDGSKVLEHLGGYGDDEDYVHVRVFVEAKLPDASLSNPVIANATTWVDFMEPTEEYNLPSDTSMLIGWYEELRVEYDGQIRNEDHPNGDHATCRVTDVFIAEEVADDGYDKVLNLQHQEWESGDGIDRSWGYEAVGHGHATIQMSYVTESGQIKDHTFVVYVSADVYDVQVWSADWADSVLPGTTVDLYAQGVHHREEQGDTTEGLTYVWELNDGYDVGSLMVDPNDPQHATFTVNSPSADKMGFDDLVDVCVILYDGGTSPAAYGDWAFWVRNDYTELWPTHIDENLALGATQDFNVELRHYRWDEFEDGYEVVEGVHYELDEVDTASVVISDDTETAVENGEIEAGAYTIKRLSSEGTSFTLRCWYNDDNGEVRSFNRWYNLRGRGYGLWFEDVPERVVIDDEHPTATLALNTQDFEGVEDVAYDVTVGLWENDQWVETLQQGTDYVVDGNEIVLDGAVILGHFDTHEIGLRVYVEAMWNGQRLSDTDCWVTLFEPYVEYWQQQDRDILPGWDGTVDGFGRAWVFDADHSDAWETEYEVTDVQVISGEEHLAEFHADSDDDNHWWYYRAEDFGTVTFKVTYLDLDGVEQSYSFSLNIVGTTYSLDFSASESGEHLLPGATVEVWADAVRHTAVQCSDDQGNTWYEDETSTDGLSYVWDKTESEDLFEIQQDASDPSHITVQVNDVSDAQQDINRTIVMRVKVLEDDEVVATSRWAYDISTDFIEVWPAEIDGDMAIGGSQDVNLELRHYVYGQDGYTTVDDALFFFWYDGNCLSITDGQGEAVVDNGGIPEGEAEVGYPAGNFTIARTGDWDTEISIRAAWMEGTNAQSVWRNWHMNRQDYDMAFGDAHDLDVWALESDDDYYVSLVDETNEVTLSGDLAAVEGLTIEYTVGTWENDSYTKIFDADSGLYTVSDDGLSITSNAAEMARQGVSDLRVVAAAKLGDHKLCETHNDFWFHLRQSEESYNLKRDESLLVDWWGRVDNEGDAFVRNPDYPEGQHFSFPITNVELVSENPAVDGEDVIELLKVYTGDDSGEDFCWEYWALGHGTATLKVTYTDISGETRTHVFTVSVVSDVYNVDVWAVGSDTTMPGGSVTLQAEGIHHQENAADTQEGLTYQWEIDPEVVDQGICQLVVDPDDPSRATVTFAETPNHGAMLYWREAWVTVRLFDAGEEVAANNINAICCSDYEEVWPASLDRDLDVNQSITVTPEVRHYCASFLELDEPYEYEVVDGATFNWNYDENAFDVSDNGDGSYTITRTAHWASNLKLSADWIDTDGNPAHDERTYPFSYRELRDLSNAAFDAIDAQTYSGSELTPEVTLTDGDKTLVEGTDYTLEYIANVNAGTATVTATGKGGYGGTVSTTFTIMPKAVTLVPDPDKLSKTYGDVDPELTATAEGLVGSDMPAYTITRAEGEDAGTYALTTTAEYDQGNYLVSIAEGDFFFTINPKRLTIKADSLSKTYGEADPELTATVTGLVGDDTASSTVRYALSRVEGEDAGAYFINVKDVEVLDGNYTASTTRGTLTIQPKDLANVTVSNISNKTYTGKALTPAVTVKDGAVKLVKDTDYTVAYANNTKVGTATATITGTGNYVGTVSKTFKIVGPLSKATVSAVANQTYTGKAITPAPTVKFGSTTLKKGTHYTLSYTNNVKVGTATITITGKGYYTGTKSVTFKITAPISKATVTGVSNKAYTGKAITLSPTVKYAGVTLKKGTDYTLSFKDNVKAGTATMTIKGKGFYTGSKTVTFKITAKGTWKKSGSKWWYCYSNGDYPYSQFLDIDSARYYFDKNGYMVTGWQQVGSDWYYFRSDGKMAVGWFKDGSSWYYLLKSGADAGKMAKGWQQIDGKYYYFYSSGVMATSTKIDGYTIGADGARK